MYQGVATKVLTGEVRLSYVSLANPRVEPNGDEKYSATLLIPKSDVTTYNLVMAAIEAAAVAAMSGSWNGARPPILDTPIHDGDGVKQNGTPYGEECKGHWVMTATAKADKHKPQVVHINNVKQELAPVDVYSGMYARVTVNFWGYNFNGRKGISCQLNNVCKTRDGEPLSGRANAEADFSSIEDNSQPPWNNGMMQPQPQQPMAYPGAHDIPTYGIPAAAVPPPQYQPQYSPPQINPITGLPMNAAVS